MESEATGAGENTKFSFGKSAWHFATCTLQVVVGRDETAARVSTKSTTSASKMNKQVHSMLLSGEVLDEDVMACHFLHAIQRSPHMIFVQSVPGMRNRLPHPAPVQALRQR